MKYRPTSKIKTKHSLINGLYKFLLKIEPWPEIKSINPGEIKPTKKRQGKPFAFKIQYQTKTGLKCLAQSQGIQEVFLVSPASADLSEKLNHLITNP